MKHPRGPIKIHVPGVEVVEPAHVDAFTDEDLRGPARYYDVTGQPVSLGKVAGCPYRCAMWSDGRPRIFSEMRVRTHGKQITERAFRDLILANKLGY